MAQGFESVTFPSVINAWQSRCDGPSHFWSAAVAECLHPWGGGGSGERERASRRTHHSQGIYVVFLPGELLQLKWPSCVWSSNSWFGVARGRSGTLGSSYTNSSTSSSSFSSTSFSSSSSSSNLLLFFHQTRHLKLPGPPHLQLPFWKFFFFCDVTKGSEPALLSAPLLRPSWVFRPSQEDSWAGCPGKEPGTLAVLHVR